MDKKSQPLPLSEKEKRVLEFLEGQMGENGIAPSYQEIRDHFGFASFNSVQNYIKQLSNKGYILQAQNQKRAIQILHSSSSVQNSVIQLKDYRRSQEPLHASSLPTNHGEELPLSPVEALSLPLLGRVAAGAPIEEYEHDEYVEVPASMVRNPKKSYALKIKGHSMIEDGIFDGDIILVQKQTHVADGEIVVASIDGESTVKRIYCKQNKIELRPSNSTMQSMWYDAKKVQVQGVVVGLIRKF